MTVQRRRGPHDVRTSTAGSGETLEKVEPNQKDVNGSAQVLSSKWSVTFSNCDVLQQIRFPHKMKKVKFSLGFNL